MKLDLYQVDAFASKLFTGNPAAVIPLEKWIGDELMQTLAMENNLSETVFFVPSENSEADYDIRWFTPEAEVNLCGHATLASAFVLFTLLKFNKTSVVFSSKSGLLKITRKDDLFEMEFPSWKPERITDYPQGLEAMLGVKEIIGTYRYRDLIVEVAHEEEVKCANPDFTAMKKTGEKIILTAKGDNDADFVSRFFAPSIGVNEDPVTGSAHSQLIPLWSEKLSKSRMFAKQLSKRGGEIFCEQVSNEKVMMGGKCVFYMKGEIFL